MVLARQPRPEQQRPAEPLDPPPMTFPARWAPGTTHFKEGGSLKVARAIKGYKIAAGESKHKRAVRTRDKRCRFPLCGCAKFKLGLHVAHLQHKGAGGNPKGDRSATHKMILLCSARHRENRISLDRGTIRIRPLTLAGTAGPCVWDVDTRDRPSTHAQWTEVGREVTRGIFEPFTPEQRAILDTLSPMTR